MTIAKPDEDAQKEKITLQAAAGYILEECRMVLPGIQALFGFQLIAVFDQDFFTMLSPHGQIVHLVALVLVSISIALVMSPAALHRQTHQHSVSERFIRMASRLLLAGMFPLLIGISLEVFLVASLVARSSAAGGAIALAVAAVFILLWIVLPRRERGRPG
jgi:hypothetical protein